MTEPNEEEPPESFKIVLGDPDSHSENGYFIDGQEVDAASFEKFKELLTPVEGTWYCADMNDGGMTSEDLRSTEGVVYRYEAETTTEVDRTSLTRRPR